MTRIVLFVLILPLLGIAAGSVWVANNLPGIFDGLGPVFLGFVILSGSMIVIPRLRSSRRPGLHYGPAKPASGPVVISQGVTKDEKTFGDVLLGELIVEAASSREIQNNMALPPGCVIRSIEQGRKYRVLWRLEPGLAAAWIRANGYRESKK